MKTLLISLLFIFTVSSAFSNYVTPGTGKSWNMDSLVANSGGAVTFSAGSYLVNDSIYINTTDTLFIRTNAVIKFSAGNLMDVNGVLIVNPPDSVKITAQDTSAKFFFLGVDSSNSTVLKKLIFEYGYAIRTLDCSILIDSCTIRYNAASTTISSYAINLFRSNSTISNCKIYRNQRAGIGGGSNIANSPQIINNLIYENDTENGNYPQINMGASNSTPPLVIRGNTITGLYIMSGGIAIFPTGNNTAIIENNIIKKNRYGMVLQGANISAYVNNNIIDSNNIQGLPNLGGSGINIVGNQNSIFTRNIIRGNLWGVTLQSGAKPNFGDLTTPDTTDRGLNQIYNNSNTGKIYDFYNNTSNNVMAENNYWGTTIVDTVEAHIVHQPDSSVYGLVDYLPIRTVTGITEISSTSPSDFTLYDAYPNPFNPSTTIRFSLPEAANAKLVIYDNIGKEAAVLFNAKLNAGTYQYQWNASGFASGIYYYRLETSTFTAVKKLMLIK